MAAVAPTRAGRLSSGGHILSLDSYRFLAASLIVVLHYDSDFVLGLSARLPTIKVLDLFVDFFFILSGFVIARGYASRVSTVPQYLTFLQRRAARIYPLHLLTLGGVVAMVLAAQAMHAPINHPEIYDWHTLPAAVFLVQAWGVLPDNVFNLPAWSISAEQFVYLLFPLFVALGNRLPFVVNCLLIAAFAALFQISGLVPAAKHWTHVNAEFGNLRAVPTFFLGILMSLALDRTIPRVILGWRAIHLLFVACVAGLLLGLPDELILLGFAIVLYCAANAELAGARTILATKFFARLGDASFAIYLTHRVIDIPVVFLVKKTGLMGTAVAPLIAVATYGLCVVLSLACYYYFESPARRYLSGLSFGRRQAEASN
jgi:peptidoglycan/LPS O-acetylase OafA/YrhL